MPLRPEILVLPRDDGGVDLYDPLLEQLYCWPEVTRAHLLDPDPELVRRLAAASLLEGELAQVLREQIIASRRRVPPLPAPVAHVPAVDWTRAEDLPDGVSPRWRDGEGLRRAAEDRAAGRELTVLRAFLAPAFAEVLLRQVTALPMERLDQGIVHADRHRLEAGLPSLRRLLLDPLTRELLGAVLGVALPDGLAANAWRFGPGDHLSTHPDGKRYRATFAVGLCSGWSAADGGAIAFGPPSPDGTLRVQERWLPHLGDVCLFVPGPTTWHCVEPPSRTRWTVSGWWTDGARLPQSLPLDQKA